MAIPNITSGGVKKIAAGSLAAVFVLAAGFGSFYTVEKSEMANVRRFGDPVYDQPVGSGPHMKIPFVDKVDKIQVSLTTLHIPPFKVNTVDNQQITLDLNFNFTVPQNKVNHLLYEVGRSGNSDITESIIPVVMDRAGRVFNKQNTTTISLKREEIQAEVTKEVFNSVREQFGLEPHSLQFAQIQYSPAFVESNENAVKAKNMAVAEENKVAVEKAIADQAVIKAKGQADAAIEAARGESQSVLLRAQSEKTRLELQGQGQSALLRTEIATFGSPELYIKYLNAKAQNLWDGKAPQVMSGAGGSSTVVVPLPLTEQAPAAKAPAPQPKP
jgi:regulator of protease activity HflC (stomatin/prohibitin superfamily)